MQKSVRSAQSEMFVKMLLGTVRIIPTVHPSKRTIREVRKIYDSLTKPKDVLLKEKSFTKDKTKFTLDGQKYGKGRFALNVIKAYVEKNNPTLDQLKAEFPDNLAMEKYQTLGLIKEISEIKHKDRYFIKDVITTSDNKKVVMCSQFGISNIMPMFRKAKKLGFNVQKMSK